MVNEGRGSLFRRKDGKYLLYIPVDLADDSMFPFKNYVKTKRGADAIPVRISFKHGESRLFIEKWKELEEKKE
jgi:hypothetical protein